MSGGVDSSVSALLLKEQGFEVIGLYMKNWEEEKDGTCHAAQDYEDVVKVCGILGIPHYTVNFVEEYWDAVFSGFLEEIKLGFTPNPDILCNREIKFKRLFEKAKMLGADFLATGHYAQIRENQLVRGLDPAKDQSYFLYTLKQDLLSSVLFPVGGMQKKEVKALAKKAGLPVAEKKESMGICFIGKRDFKPFLQSYIAAQKGHFETLDGKIVGEHDGACFYTIGQRKGLCIGGAGDAWFVVKKDMARNAVIVEQGKDHPALYSKHVYATDASWVGQAPQLPLTCTAKVRYRQADQECIVEQDQANTLLVTFKSPQRAVTPRQSIVFYQGDVCLGGALIA